MTGMAMPALVERLLRLAMVGDRSGAMERSAPLGATTQGRLHFPHGASNLKIVAGENMDELFRARLEGPHPEVSVVGGSVRIEVFKGFHPFDWRRRSAYVELNPSIPWAIEVVWGVSKMTADLSGLHLTELRMTGGASEIEVRLGQARGIVPVSLTGGLSAVTIQRAGAAALLRLKGGATRLAFDGQYFGAVGGLLRVGSPGAEETADRYEIDVVGGASDLSIFDK